MPINKSEGCSPPHPALYIAAGLLMPLTCIAATLFSPEVPRAIAYVAAGIIGLADIGVYGTIISFPARAAKKLINKGS